MGLSLTLITCLPLLPTHYPVSLLCAAKPAFSWLPIISCIRPPLRLFSSCLCVLNALLLSSLSMSWLVPKSCQIPISPPQPQQAFLMPHRRVTSVLGSTVHCSISVWFPWSWWPDHDICDGFVPLFSLWVLRIQKRGTTHFCIIPGTLWIVTEYLLNGINGKLPVVGEL